ncbi:hypothetical protein E2C01_098482 [Portunus trituberculatus]|uniref:Uncharacterized protein n=1 Tax=Portunus trituberculatus TaxID=210409 RepID=A0A5B7KEB3_PORTR|nr:hypothetical protein [Portunus trituberculatus]
MHFLATDAKSSTRLTLFVVSLLAYPQRFRPSLLPRRTETTQPRFQEHFTLTTTIFKGRSDEWRFLKSVFPYHIV